MEYMSGNIFVRTNDVPMRAGEVVLGHRHNFDHTTFVKRGRLEVNMLDVRTVNAYDQPVEAVVVESIILDPADAIDWRLIPKGRYHMLRALEDGTFYRCIYSHQFPQALTLDRPGGQKQLPYTMRDEGGVLWVRVNEKIVQDTAAWALAYQ